MNLSCISNQFSLRFNRWPNRTGRHSWDSGEDPFKRCVRLASQKNHQNDTRTLSYTMEGTHHRSVLLLVLCAVHSADTWQHHVPETPIQRAASINRNWTCVYVCVSKSCANTNVTKYWLSYMVFLWYSAKTTEREGERRTNRRVWATVLTQQQHCCTHTVHESVFCFVFCNIQYKQKRIQYWW